jgi:hypothetical protein
LVGTESRAGGVERVEARDETMRDLLVPDAGMGSASDLLFATEVKEDTVPRILWVICIKKRSTNR